MSIAARDVDARISLNCGCCLVISLCPQSGVQQEFRSDRTLRVQNRGAVQRPNGISSRGPEVLRISQTVPTQMNVDVTRLKCTN
jgi:hypothetical protein